MAKDPVEITVERPVLKVPSYRLHKARGLAVVTIRGRNIYLGRYDSPESRAAYDRVIREFTASRGVAPGEGASAVVTEFDTLSVDGSMTLAAASELPPGTRLAVIDNHGGSDVRRPARGICQAIPVHDRWDWRHHGLQTRTGP